MDIQKIKLTQKWGTIIGEKVIPDLLGNLPVELVLIHGQDINSHTNQPWVFDTRSYFGYNEMDLSLIHYSDKELNWPGGKVPEVCKGEFSEPEFLAEYQKCHSLLSGFEERKTLYRLYDYLFRKIVALGRDGKGKWRQKTLTMMKKLT